MSNLREVKVWETMSVNPEHNTWLVFSLAMSEYHCKKEERGVRQERKEGVLKYI